MSLIVMKQSNKKTLVSNIVQWTVRGNWKSKIVKDDQIVSRASMCREQGHVCTLRNFSGMKDGLRRWALDPLERTSTCIYGLTSHGTLDTPSFCRS